MAEGQQMSLLDFLNADTGDFTVQENIDDEYKENLSPEDTKVKLEKVGELCEEAEAQQLKVQELSQQLKNEEAKLKELLTVTIPETLESAGLKELKLTSGRKITIADELTYSMTEKNRAACMQWLRDKEYDSIIKNVVTAQFTKGEDALANELYQEMLAQGLNVTHKEDVHFQTMKAFLKEQVVKNALSTSDKELFGVYEYKQAKIK